MLAAGRGTRMRPLTLTRPKVLLPVGPERLAGRVLRQLADAGVAEATVVVGYRGEAVRAALGDGSRWGLEVTYVTQDPPRGTGDAVLQARGEGGDVLVVNGDVLLPDDALPRLADEAGWALAAARVEDPAGLGVLETDGPRVTRVVEKSPTPPSDLANAGAYHLPGEAWELLEKVTPSPRGEVELTDALTLALQGGRDVRALEVEGWLDVAAPWDLLEANALALQDLDARVEGDVHPQATLEGPVHVAAGARVRAGAVLEGPCIVGPGSHVGPNCYVRPGTTLVRDVRVGHAVEVKNSVLLPGATVGHLAYVGDSVLGARVNLGAGTKVANLRHDGGNVHARVAGERVDTGRRKLGVVLADDVHTGINTSLNVGVVLGPHATTRPGETVLRSRY